MVLQHKRRGPKHGAGVDDGGLGISVEDRRESGRQSGSGRGRIGGAMGAVSKTMHDYAEVATMHGVYYAFESKYGRLSSAFWILVCGALISLAAVLIAETYTTWQSNLIMTTVNTTGLPIRDIAFPAVTICGLGSVEEVMQDRLYDQAIEYAAAKKGDPEYGPSDEWLEEEECNQWKWYRLLDHEGLEPRLFLQETYPDLKDDPATLFSVLIASNPDAILLSEYAFGSTNSDDCVGYKEGEEGGDDDDDNDPCSAENAPAFDLATACGDTDYAYYDGLCLKVGENMIVTEEKAVEICDDLAGELVYIPEAEYLTALKTLILNQSNPLSNLKDKTFWVEGLEDFSSSPDIYAFAAGGLSTESIDEEYLCSVMTFDSALGKFVGRYRDCEQRAWPLCMAYEYNPCEEDEEASYSVTAWPCDPSQPQPEDEPCLLPGKPFVDRLVSNDAAAKKERSKATLKRKKAYTELFKTINFDLAHTTIFNLLWKSTLPCYQIDNSQDVEMIKNCVWKGVRLPCAGLFNMFPTDRGMCCTFNMDAADKLFKESQYRTNILQNQKKDLLKSDVTGTLPSWYVNGSEPIPRVGVSKGLSLVLDAHTDRLAAGSVSEDFQGFYAVVDSKDAYPQVDQRNIRIRPGYDNLVSLDATSVTASEDIRSVDPSVRNCYFADEYELDLHQHYSQSSCLLECKIEYVMHDLMETENATCVPWYLPSADDNNATMCDPWMGVKFHTQMERVPDDECTMCLPDCSTTTYRASVSSVPFRKCDEKNMGVSYLCDLTGDNVISPPIYGSLLHQEYEVFDEFNGTPPDYVKAKRTNRRRYSSASYPMFYSYKDEEYDAFEKDIATVHFYFESSTVFQFGRDLRMTTVGFISQVGGLLGLCIGFSLASLVEIVYWMTARMWAETNKNGDSRWRNGRGANRP